MAQFHATIKGQRGGASRLGSKRSGIVANINGWDAGIRVEAFHEDGQDTFRVYATSGSNESSPDVLLGVLRQRGQDNRWICKMQCNE